MLRAGKHMGSWRWQQLGRHALDLLTPAWMDDNSFESNLRGAAVRSGVHGELMTSCRNFRFLFRIYNTHESSIWNSYALVCTSAAATARKLRALKSEVRS